MLRNSAINFVLKIGLGLTCLGFALYSLAYPNIILEFYPQFIPNIIGDLTTLIIGSLAALVMAIWIFSRKHKFACSFSFLLLIFLAIITNLTSLRFISVAWPLFIISLALAIRYYPRVRIIIPHKDGERMRIVPIEPDADNGDRKSAATDEEDAADKIEDMLLHKIKKEPVREAVSAPAPTIDETPADLGNDPAQTTEFLNNEKFVRGNKFFEKEQTVIEDAVSAADMISIDIAPTPPANTKPKRAYRPRTKVKSDSISSKHSANSEIHEEF
jgi:hypothetical protein